jgi:hypothetical protein
MQCDNNPTPPTTAITTIIILIIIVLDSKENSPFVNEKKSKPEWVVVKNLTWH